MKLQVLKLDGTSSGEISLDDAIFAIEPKTESLSDVVRWQLARRQAGTHAVKGRSDVARTGKKLYRQKGTGRARHGARTANIFVGGGVIFGPVPRSHAFKINRKVRQLALKTMLSLKVRENNLVVLEDLVVADGKTKTLLASLQNLSLKSALFVDGETFDTGFARACANIYGVDMIPACGLNVYDGLKHEKILLTRAAADLIQERLR